MMQAKVHGRKWFISNSDLASQNLVKMTKCGKLAMISKTTQGLVSHVLQ